MTLTLDLTESRFGEMYLAGLPVELVPGPLTIEDILA